MKTSISLKDLEIAFGEAPEDAVNYFKKKGFKVSNNFKDYIEAVQKHAFTVAGVTKLSILKDFKELILKGLENEISISEFRRDMKARLAEYGWQDTEVNKNYRLNNIYRTNIQESLNIARTEQMQSVKEAFPYIQNISILDKVTTDECDFLNGKVFSQDDKEFFSNYAPMGHYGCRRRIRAVSERMFKAMKTNLSKTSQAIVQKHKNQKGFLNKTKPFKPDLSDFPSELKKVFKKNK